MRRCNVLLDCIHIESTDGNLARIPIPIVTCTLSIPVPILQLLAFVFPWEIPCTFPVKGTQTHRRTRGRITYLASIRRRAGTRRERGHDLPLLSTPIPTSSRQFCEDVGEDVGVVECGLYGEYTYTSNATASRCHSRPVLVLRRLIISRFALSVNVIPTLARDA